MGKLVISYLQITEYIGGTYLVVKKLYTFLCLIFLPFVQATAGDTWARLSPTSSRFQLQVLWRTVIIDVVRTIIPQGNC